MHSYLAIHYIWFISLLFYFIYIEIIPKQHDAFSLATICESPLPRKSVLFGFIHGSLGLGPCGNISTDFFMFKKLAILYVLYFHTVCQRACFIKYEMKEVSEWKRWYIMRIKTENEFYLHIQQFHHFQGHFFIYFHTINVEFLKSEITYG